MCLEEEGVGEGAEHRVDEPLVPLPHLPAPTLAPRVSVRPARRTLTRRRHAGPLLPTVRGAGRTGARVCLGGLCGAPQDAPRGRGRKDRRGEWDNCVREGGREGREKQREEGRETERGRERNRERKGDLCEDELEHGYRGTAHHKRHRKRRPHLPRPRRARPVTRRAAAPAPTRAAPRRPWARAVRGTRPRARPVPAQRAARPMPGQPVQATPAGRAAHVNALAMRGQPGRLTRGRCAGCSRPRGPDGQRGLPARHRHPRHARYRARHARRRVLAPSGRARDAGGDSVVRLKGRRLSGTTKRAATQWYD